MTRDGRFVLVIFNIQEVILLQSDNISWVFFFSDANTIDYVTSAIDADITEITSHTSKQSSVHGEEKLKNYLGLVNGSGTESSYNDTSSLHLM